jgi:multicomponent Na+:H+ antiporter subunit E
MSDIVEGHAKGQETTTGHRAVGYGVMFIFGFVFWLLLVWPVTPSEGRLIWGDIVAGLGVAGLAALVSREIVTQRFGRLFDPARYIWAMIYLFVFAYYVVKANVDVAYRVLHPNLPIRPGIVRTRSELRTASARTLLANCITLTPGTLTIDIAEDGTFYIHWINVGSVDEEEATKAILGRFEWFIRRILE